MAYRFTFELVLSDAASAAISKYDVNVSQVACEAVFAYLQAKIESERAMEIEQNADLREQIRQLEKEVHQHTYHLNTNLRRPVSKK
jgi:hypothetical protein